MTSLADRLNQIVSEQKITKSEFAHRIGVTKNYICILTGKNPRQTVISVALARLISIEFGYSETWILTGEGDER